MPLSGNDNYRSVAVALNGTTAVQLLPANINRKFLYIDNPNAAAMSISFDGVNYITIPANGFKQFDTNAPMNTVTMKYSTTGTFSIVAIEG